jgi:protocatechuate 3,4-dioxygenase beta subunit
MCSVVRFCAAALLLAATTATTCYAQGAVGGSLTGVVTDETGALVPNAQVSLTNEATAVRLETRTNDVGTYMFNNLSPGRYTLAAQVTGFAPVQVTGLTVSVAQFARAACR